jgi:hypothetical protein
MMAKSIEDEIERLESHLQELAAQADEELLARYQIKRAPRPEGLYWRLRGFAAHIVRQAIAISPWRNVPWPVCLKQSPLDPKAKPLLVWAVGTDSNTIREGCSGLSERWGSFPGFAPVLITDVADFAFYSRLGWLVEYLPRLAGEGEAYEERKLKYIARLYRGARVLPVSAGLHAGRHSDPG